ncbi:MAG TPA: hypothetical protein VHD81_09495 [Mycobacteriales bacterium]|nr:hypothetical protein [Mycobacteriales bacterium]
MTDLNDRLAAMLDNEPPAPYDIDRVVSDGRRALRRRTTLTAVAGTAGTAAVTAAVVVPIAAAHHDGTTKKITVVAQPSATAAGKCELYYKPMPHGNRARKLGLGRAIARAHTHTKPGYEVTGVAMKNGAYVIRMCPPGARPDDGQPSTPPDPTATMPPYHYDADPQTIADGFARELGKQVKKLGFTIVYSRPFAQESSTLEKGHPTYYDGNVDVQLPDGPADIGVQVSHAVTQLVPFTGDCTAPTCEQTTLPDGSLLQVSHVTAGTGGGEVIVAEIHYANGVVVQAQESNYAFGPEATRDRTKNQPLTIDQLTELAKDPAWTF